MNKPYTQFDANTRFFSSRTTKESLVWHVDKEDRDVEVISDSKGWSFQSENGLPQELRLGSKISIGATEWHRLLKTDDATDLLIKIIPKV